ncbi:MAG: hypothetical protein GX138_03700 [Firmicutes bacterium]|jgi:hypothetical protein|nr:hypothetical protein [Bacillota bacterium]
MQKVTSKHLKVLISVLLFGAVLFTLSGCNPKEPEVVEPQTAIFEFTQVDELAEIRVFTDGQELPESKDDGELKVSFEMSMGDELLEAYGTIRVQGTSTASWAKKNWTLKFYADPEHKDPIKVKIGDSIPSDKWVAKAEWIDPTMSRNGISFRLWEAMVNSRQTEPKLEVDNAFAHLDPEEIEPTGAVGFPKTFPAIVYMDDQHYGLALLLLGHDPDNFNIDKNNPNHIYMEFDAQHGEPPEKSWIKFSAQGIGPWIDSYYPKNDDLSPEQIEAIDQLGKFLNSEMEDFAANFDDFLDRRNIIDMLLFMEMIYDWDAVAQDLEIVTYDLKKWYFLPWDKDTTFGLWWDGSGLLEGSSTRRLYSYVYESVEEKPWFKTYHTFTDQVEARYAELRDAKVFSAEAISDFALDILEKYDNEMWEAEYERWEEAGRPSVGETDLNQILSWFGERLIMLDEHFNYNP